MLSSIPDAWNASTINETALWLYQNKDSGICDFCYYELLAAFLSEENRYLKKEISFFIRNIPAQRMLALEVSDVLSVLKLYFLDPDFDLRFHWDPRVVAFLPWLKQALRPHGCISQYFQQECDFIARERTVYLDEPVRIGTDVLTLGDTLYCQDKDCFDTPSFDEIRDLLSVSSYDLELLLMIDGLINDDMTDFVNRNLQAKYRLPAYKTCELQRYVRKLRDRLRYCRKKYRFF